jgi:hypothetical protein
VITAETIRQALQCNNPSCECHKPNGKVHCPTPGHHDLHPSFSVDRGDNGKILVKCQSKCRDNQDLPVSALKARRLWPSGNGNGSGKFNIIKEYDYQDQAGKLVYQVCRTDTKEFPQRRPDPANPGKWIWGIKGVPRYPYRLPELLKAETVLIPEGEQDCDRLAAVGFTSTCNSGGAGNWPSEINQYFKGKSVVILPDNDNPGRDHALKVARNLHGVATSIKVLALPDLPEKGDVSDWLATVGTVEQLQALVEATPEFDPANALSPVQVPAEPESKPTQSEILIRLTSHGEFFHDCHKVGYVTLPGGKTQATFPIRSTDFRLWLRRAFFLKTGKAPNAQALNDALGVLEAQALFDGSTLPIYVRVGEHEGKIYLDLRDTTWRAVEVDAEGWRVVPCPPMKFVRRAGMLPLPIPRRGGSITELRPFLNLPAGEAGERAWRLIVSYLVMALRATGPYPILAIHGVQGSAKSTIARILRALHDPNSSPLRAEPKEIRDLVISAKNGWCCVFDNLTSIPQWLSDGLCRLSTGGGGGHASCYPDRNQYSGNQPRPHQSPNFS